MREQTEDAEEVTVEKRCFVMVTQGLVGLGAADRERVVGLDG